MLFLPAGIAGNVGKGVDDEREQVGHDAEHKCKTYGLHDYLLGTPTGGIVVQGTDILSGQNTVSRTWSPKSWRCALPEEKAVYNNYRGEKRGGNHQKLGICIAEMLTYRHRQGRMSEGAQFSFFAAREGMLSHNEACTPLCRAIVSRLSPSSGAHTLSSFGRLHEQNTPISFQNVIALPVVPWIASVRVHNTAGKSAGQFVGDTTRAGACHFTCQ